MPRYLMRRYLMPQFEASRRRAFCLGAALFLCLGPGLSGCNRSGVTGPPAPEVTLADVEKQIQDVKNSKNLRPDQKATLLRNLESEKPLLGGTMDPGYTATPKPGGTPPPDMSKVVLPVIPTPAP